MSDLIQGIYDFELQNEVVLECLNIAHNCKNSKQRNKNFFYSIPYNLHVKIITHVCEKFENAKTYKWVAEIGKFYESVGYHNDNNKNGKSLCKKGFIIPLEWSHDTSTEFTNLSCPKKIIKKGYNQWHDVEAKKDYYSAIPFKEVGSIDNFSWQKNKIIFFDSDRIHRSSPYYATNQYKISINALGYVNENTQ